MTTYLDPGSQINYMDQNSNTLGATNNHNGASDIAHVQTYTAGEDASRLAAAAKELGLSRQRKKRKQVRTFGRDFQGTLNTLVFLKDTDEIDIYETLAGLVGNVLEWYDFAVFGYFSDIIGQVFFPPNQEGNAATIESFAVFGAAFLMRPIGGVLLGYVGDTFGRKKALSISIFLMAFPTFAMGCLPSYAQAGWFSTISLILIRMLQGMSVGGQLMASLVFTLENADRDKWGLYASYVWAAGNFGTLLGGVVGSVIRATMTPEQLLLYGWRIPFLSGIIVSVAGFYLRSSEGAEDDDNKIDEEGEEEVEETQPTNALVEALKPENFRALLAATMVPVLSASGFYLTYVWMAIYMATLSEVNLSSAMTINSTTLLIASCIFLPLPGWLSDKYGRKFIMSIGAVAIGLLGPSMVTVIGSSGSPYLAFGAQFVLGISYSLWVVPMGAYLMESFPPESRLTSVSIGYNLAMAIVAGSTPAVATTMVDVLGPTSPGWIYTVTATLSMIGLWIVAPKPPELQYTLVV
mmetsp:Transcript_10104/g.14822  ORF Transcript_10104/g.14822 Transcript_10104/m.14822 type:complete len:521 (-) Transcript_10104:113-1675(-)